MKYRVRATEAYKELHIKDEELNRIPEPGEEFTISKERLQKLQGNNRYKANFVVVIPEEKKIETATAEKREIEPKSSKHVKKRPIQK